MHPLLTPLALLLAFFSGSIPTAYLMGRIRGIDIRRHGSGNVGATNAFRVLGKEWGIACLLFDMLKGWAPVFLLASVRFAPAWPPLGWAWALGLAAILGHMFSPFVGFKGGKGVATSLGVLLAIHPLPMLAVLALGLAIIGATGYVSLASITGAILLPPLFGFWTARGEGRVAWLSVAITALLGAVIVWRHRANIARLRAGTENRIIGNKRTDRTS